MKASRCLNCLLQLHNTFAVILLSNIYFCCIFFLSLVNLPTTSTLIVLSQLLQANPWHKINAQVNMPLSPSVTFEIVRVNFSVAIQLKLYLWSDGFTNPACPDDRTPATLPPLNATVNPLKPKSDEKLKFQVSGKSVTPSRSRNVFNLWSKLWSESVSSGGGSYHVTLAPSEISSIWSLKVINRQVQNKDLRVRISGWMSDKICPMKFSFVSYT